MASSDSRWMCIPLSRTTSAQARSRSRSRSTLVSTSRFFQPCGKQRRHRHQPQRRLRRPLAHKLERMFEAPKGVGEFGVDQQGVHEPPDPQEEWLPCEHDREVQAASPQWRRPLETCAAPLVRRADPGIHSPTALSLIPYKTEHSSANATTNNGCPEPDLSEVEGARFWQVGIHELLLAHPALPHPL